MTNLSGAAAAGTGRIAGAGAGCTAIIGKALDQMFAAAAAIFDSRYRYRELESD